MILSRHFPQSRLRRNRKTLAIRNLTAENSLSADDLILPLFVTANDSSAIEIPSLAFVRRHTVSQLIPLLTKACLLGVKSFMIFPHVNSDLKDANGSHALSSENIVVKSLKTLVPEFPDCLFIADVALDPYTSHGHDGILNESGDVDNDQTLEVLAKQAIVLAEAGAAAVAPSDMMDGRVQKIRDALDQHNFKDCIIMSYSAKYASALYGPFRSAVGSIGLLTKGKASYQLDSRNSDEALAECRADIEEGADWLIVKPGGFYLDVLYRVSQEASLPVFAYQVSGEYAMIQNAAEHDMDASNVLLESLIAFKRAGASGIITYGALKAAALIK